MSLIVACEGPRGPFAAKVTNGGPYVKVLSHTTHKHDFELAFDFVDGEHSF